MALKKATCEKAAIKMAVYGPAGSGKTLTALIIAEAIAAATKKRIAFIDTENGTDFYAEEVRERTIHPKPFDFDRERTRSIAVVNKTLNDLKASEHSVVVIDSVTHLWEAAIAAYSGRRGADGQLPMHAWGAIKKPWKQMIEWMLNSPQHVIICGRLGNKFTEDDDGKVHSAGVKLKAEGETGYEPDFLLQLQPEQFKSGATAYYAYGEKDRTGVLRGRKLCLWDGDNTDPNTVRDIIVRPLMRLLGNTHAKVETQDETAARDQEEIEKADAEKTSKSAALLERFKARLVLAEDEAAVKSIGAEIKSASPTMTSADTKVLRAAYKNAQQRAKGETRVVLDEPSPESDEPADNEVTSEQIEGPPEAA